MVLEIIQDGKGFQLPAHLLECKLGTSLKVRDKYQAAVYGVASAAIMGVCTGGWGRSWAMSGVETLHKYSVYLKKQGTLESQFNLKFLEALVGASKMQLGLDERILNNDVSTFSVRKFAMEGRKNKEKLWSGDFMSTDNMKSRLQYYGRGLEDKPLKAMFKGINWSLAVLYERLVPGFKRLIDPAATEMTRAEDRFPLFEMHLTENEWRAGFSVNDGKRLWELEPDANWSPKL